ncbi:MAG: alpha-amylase/4-alpha-glucanotransferase domain-containing protein, partial [Candidatus Fermentibacteria bacterium]
HDDMASKEDGLADRVTVDRWRRVCFSDLVISSSLNSGDWGQSAAEITHFQKSASSSSMSAGDTALCFRGEFEEGKLRIVKELTVDLEAAELGARTEYAVMPGDRAGMEICLNLMTGQSADRYYRIDPETEHLMSEAGEFRGKRIEIYDCWRKVKTVIEMTAEADIWVTPLDSVNRSESGYERVHQGAAFCISGISDDTGVFDLEISLRMEVLNDT